MVSNGSNFLDGNSTYLKNLSFLLGVENSTVSTVKNLDSDDPYYIFIIFMIIVAILTICNCIADRAR